MPSIRQLKIERFRGIRSLTWSPGPGLNALIGPGDSGKSTILDAIDLILATRRSASFTDADFHDLATDEGFLIETSIGDLPDQLLELDRFGVFHRAGMPTPTSATSRSTAGRSS